MKSHIITLAIILYSCTNIVVAKEDSHHLTVYKGFTTETTHPEITIFTKEDPFKTPDDQMVNALMIISPKFAKQKNWNAILDLCAPDDDKNILIGSITLRPEDFTYESSADTVKQIAITLSGKYFRKAVIRAWSDDGEIELHLRK